MATDSFQYDINIGLQTDSALRQWDKLWDQVKAGSEDAKDQINKILGGKTEVKVQLQYDSNSGKIISGTKVIRSEFDKINNLVKKRTQLEDGSITKLRQQVNQAKQARDALSRITTVTDAYGNKIKAVNQAWVTQNNRVRDLNLQIAKASGNFMQIAKARFPVIGNILSLGNGLTQVTMIASSVVQSFQAIKSSIDPIIQRQKQVEGLSLAMQGFGLNAEQAKQILAVSKEISMAYGASLGQVEKGFKRITPVILQSGGSMKDAADVMTAISARTTTLGLNTEQAGRYMEAFAQVMGKGKLQGEELNQQFAELDGALRGQIATVLKARYGINDLDGAMQKGQVSAEMFKEAFIEASSEMVENLGGAIGEVQARLDEMNVNQVQNVVNTLNTLTMDSLRESLSGIGKSFQRIWVGITQFFASIATDMPAVQRSFARFMDVVGVLADLIVRGLLASFKIVLKVIDEMLLKIQQLGDAMMNIPLLRPLVEGVKQLGGAFMDSFNQGYDMIMNTGDAVQSTSDKLSTLDGRMLQLKNRLDEGKISQEEYKQKLAELKAEADQEIQARALQKMKDEAELGKQKIKDMKFELQELKAAAAEEKDSYEREKQRLQALKDAIKERYDTEIELSKQKEEAIKISIDNEKDQYNNIKEVLKDRYDYERDRISEIYDAKLNSIQLEIDALGQRTPAEQRLYELRKQELRDKASSTKLTKKEKLEAQAQLERMLRQEKIQQLNNQKKQIQLDKQKELDKLQANYNQQLEEEKAKHEAKLNALNSGLELAEGNTKSLQAEQSGYLKQLEEADKKTIVYINNLDKIPGMIAEQASEVRRTKTAYEEAIRKVDDMVDKIKDAEKAQQALNTAIRNQPVPKTPTQSNRFAGGPVAGGNKYTVNELGREAFLSASGRLSMINAPAYGKWRAPSSGTVIPAHLTKQLDIPSGGIDTSVAPAHNSASISSGNSITELIKAIHGLAGGDTISNNVTIQAQNPVQASNNVMVQLTKLKRLRYS